VSQYHLNRSRDSLVEGAVTNYTAPPATNFLARYYRVRLVPQVFAAADESPPPAGSGVVQLLKVKWAFLHYVTYTPRTGLLKNWQAPKPEKVALPARFERETCGLGNRRSIHLSYGSTINIYNVFTMISCYQNNVLAICFCNL
jgi:hypothetical protein